MSTHTVARSYGYPYGTLNPWPPPAMLRSMVSELAGMLARAHERPLALVVESAALGARSALATMRLSAEPGAGDCSFACWYQWQHPHWRFAHARAADALGPAGGQALPAPLSHPSSSVVRDGCAETLP